MTTLTIRPTQSSVGIPSERLAQLRALAHHHGVSAVEIIERAIRRGVEAGEIADTLPGFADIAVVDDDVLFVTVRNVSLPLLDRYQANLIAAVIDAATGTAPLPGLEFKSGSAKGVDLGHGNKFYVGRHAKAVTFAIVDGRSSQTTLRTATTASIATDFARLLRKHATEIISPVIDARTGQPTEHYVRITGGVPTTDLSAVQEAQS
ncbi:hypothetical protein MEX01_05120 [Methylorubrum extorquens]|uniref:hypothetical protein n=1 Tax=Methylorubrum extorquens TaxID=408 RepID=UPI0011696400|nr:hypothetical protein [Methylorubrum extorquens]GEL39921.1 hypothetical protein MEX01_05120 [Methylorubrum extorquens]